MNIKSISIALMAGTLLSGSVFFTATASADIGIVTFSGEIVSVGTGVSSDFSIGESISGSYTFDTDGSVQDFGSFINYSFESLTFDVGSYSGSNTTPSFLDSAISVMDNAVHGDTYLIVTSSLTGAQVNGLDPTKFRFQLNDPTATVLGSLALPVSLNIADWDTTNTSLTYIALNFGTAPGTDYQVRGKITSVAISISSPIVFDPGLYTMFLVTDSSTSPSINNNGEIVYEARDGNGNPQVYSNIRGQITFSTTGNLRFPDINDTGEVVYSDFRPGGFQVFSTTRGLISPGRGNLAGINNLGEVSYNDGVGIYTSTEGFITSAIYPGETDITDSGEIIYSAADDNNQDHIYSTTRGVLVDTHGNGLINNYGDVLYIENNRLFTLDGTPLIDFSIGFFADMNDFGDIVVSALEVDENNYASFRTVLMTQRAEFYSDYNYAIYEPQTNTEHEPQELINDLIEAVIAINIQSGISNSMDAKLDATLNALGDSNENNDVAALNSLYAFCNSVDAQRGKKISSDNADALIVSVNAIIASIDEFATPCQ